MCLICGKPFRGMQKLEEHIATHIERTSKNTCTQNLFEKNDKHLGEVENESVIKNEPSDDNDGYITRKNYIHDNENFVKAEIKDDPGGIEAIEDSIHDSHEIVRGGIKEHAVVHSGKYVYRFHRTNLHTILS